MVLHWFGWQINLIGFSNSGGHLVCDGRYVRGVIVRTSHLVMLIWYVNDDGSIIVLEV